MGIPQARKAVGSRCAGRRPRRGPRWFCRARKASDGVGTSAWRARRGRKRWRVGGREGGWRAGERRGRGGWTGVREWEAARRPGGRIRPVWGGSDSASSSRSATRSGTPVNNTRVQRARMPWGDGLRRERREDPSRDASQKGMVPSSSQRPGRQIIQHCSPEVVSAAGTWKTSPTHNEIEAGAASGRGGGTIERCRVDRICARVTVSGRQPVEAGGGAGGLFTWGRPAGDRPIGRRWVVVGRTCGCASVAE